MRILIITNSCIGDAVLTTGVINHFLQQHPTAKFTIAAGHLPAPLFEDLPNLEKLIPIRKERYSKHWFKLWRQCIATKWDIIIDFKHSPTSLLLRTKKRFFQKLGRQSERKTDIPKPVENARFVKLDHVPPLHLWIGEKHHAAAKKILAYSLHKKIIALAPTANWLPKMWPMENFVALAKKLVIEEKFSDAVFLILSAPNEAYLCKPLFDTLPEDRIIDLTNDLPMLTKAACIKQANLFVGNDSGLLHIASACDIPVIGLFGPTTTTAYYPQGEKAIVIKALLNENDMPAMDQTVMRRISVNEIQTALLKFIHGENQC